MNKAEKKILCRGCRDDYYNRDGNSSTGECWLLERARVVEKTQIGWWQNGPYEWNPQTTLHCHHAPGQFAWIDRDDLRLRQNQKASAKP